MREVQLLIGGLVVGPMIAMPVGPVNILCIGDQRRWWLTLFLVGGIFFGSMLWWIVLSGLANHVRDRLNDRILLLMNRFAGLTIGGFGVAAFVLRRA
jgi:hypothetical protein